MSNTLAKKLFIRGAGLQRPEYFFWGAFVLAGILFLSPDEGTLPIPQQQTAVAQTAAAESYEEVLLEAKAAAVLDTRTTMFLFERNARSVLPLASLTKIMTAATALALVPETTVVSIDALDLQEEGDAGLVSGETWLLRDLLKLTLLKSSNDAAHAVAAAAGGIALGFGSREEGRAFFIERMNERARALSLRTLLFLNETGLDVAPTIAGGYGSARDAAMIFAHALARYPTIFEPTKWEQVVFATNGGGRNAQNTNRETGKFPLLIASKTGYTDLAGGNLALAFDADFNHPIIIVVLGSTVEGRFADAEKLVWATLEYLSRNI